MMYNQKMVCSVKCDGKILREFDDTVAIPFGSEYSLLLKNLNTRKALVKVEIDGEDVTGGGLIISPNQTVDFERYILDGNLSTGPKFKFIEKTEQISDYRGDRVEDGIVRVTYQFEAVQPTYYYDLFNTYFRSSPSIGKGGNQVYGASYLSNMSVGSSLGTNSVDGTSQETYTSGTLNISTNDAGITTKGSDSNQKFQYGNIGALEATEYVICLNLRGQVGQHVVQQPVTVRRKIRCNVCGKTNLLTNNKFCPECGTNLTQQY